MAKARIKYFFRRIEVWDEEQQKTFVFLTNHLQFGATTIAAIYKDLGKWNSFLAIKQNLKIKTFLGTGYLRLPGWAPARRSKRRALPSHIDLAEELTSPHTLGR